MSRKQLGKLCWKWAVTLAVSRREFIEYFVGILSISAGCFSKDVWQIRCRHHSHPSRLEMVGSAFEDRGAGCNEPAVEATCLCGWFNQSR